jgi:lysophospholipase L1-like esterase
MEAALVSAGVQVRVIEDCLNGRRTVWDDPYKAGRNGLVGLAQKIESHSPLELVIILLGTNDFQSMHQHNAWLSSQGIATLVSAIRAAPIEPGMPVPGVLVVAPPAIRTPKGPIAPKFEGAASKCAGLASAYRKVCEELGCMFFDSGTVITTSEMDGVHLDADQHLTLGRALGKVVSSFLG